MNASIIKADQLYKKFEDFILKNITINLDAGYIMGIIGENGAGKTAFIKMLLGLYQATGGDLQLFGKSYRDHEKEIKDQIGFVLTDDDLFFENITLDENAAWYGKYYKNYNKKALKTYCKKYEINEKKKWKELSKGEKLKFQLAFAMAHDPKLLILDEPLANFDPEFREKFLHEITQFVKDGMKSVILATHQTEELDRIADYVTYIHQGEMIFSMDKEILVNRFRLIQGEDYKINNLSKQLLIYKTKKTYASTAFVVHRAIDAYEEGMSVQIPRIEDIMYYADKSGKVGIEKIERALAGISG